MSAAIRELAEAGRLANIQARRANEAAIGELRAVPFPFALIVPWSHLISDNRKYGVVEGRMLLTADYRRAKGLVRDLAKSKLRDTEPAAFPLSLLARVWVPDNVRAHDVPNFAKNCHDALEGVVYTKDRWLYDVRWVRVGVDVDAPRAEITLTPLDAVPP